MRVWSSPYISPVESRTPSCTLLMHRQACAAMNASTPQYIWSGTNGLHNSGVCSKITTHRCRRLASQDLLLRILFSSSNFEGHGKRPRCAAMDTSNMLLYYQSALDAGTPPAFPLHHTKSRILRSTNKLNRVRQSIFTDPHANVGD